MMRQILLLGFLLLCGHGFSQNSGCRIDDFNRANPVFFLNEVHDLRMQFKYDSIISLVNLKIKEDTIEKPFYHHQLACYYALQSNYKESFINLYTALHSGVFINDVLTDTDIELLYNQPEWQNIKDTIVAIFLRNNPNIKDTSLSIRLWLMGVEDQRYRTLAINNKREKSTTSDSVMEKHNMRVIDDLSFIQELIKEKNWPYYSEVGIEAGDAAFLIVQHSGDNKLTKQALRLIEQAVQRDEASKSSYAMMLDRFLMHKNKKQIYGTQVVRYSRNGDNGLPLKGKPFLWPIDDEINVNKRREAMGMASIEEYSITTGVIYKYIPQYENMKCRALVKLLKEKCFEN